MNSFAYVCADAGVPIPGNKGASVHVASVCRAFVQAGLRGEIYTGRGQDRALDGIPIRPLRARKPMPHDGSREQREASSFLQAHGAEIVPAGNCDFIYERYSLWHAGGLARARDLEVPFVLEVNSALPQEAKRFRDLVHEELAEGIGRLLFGQADGIFCVSEQVADWVMERRGREEGVWIVPNGVDECLFSPGGPRTPLPWSGVSGPVIVFCGSFRPWHGTDELLEAFRMLAAEMRGARLVCVGDGPRRGDFERQARAWGLADRIHLTGAVPHREVAGWLRNADIAVAPYPPLEDFYFSPLKLFEFMSLGLPVVAADVGQVTEVLCRGSRGLLYTSGRADELAEQVRSLARHPSLATRIARAGRNWVLKHATWSHRAKTMLSRIRELRIPARSRVEAS